MRKEVVAGAELFLADCLVALKAMPDNSVDSIVTDPPYGLSFMGKRWDYDVPSVEIWEECLRVLKPGGHLLAFAGTRTQHRMAVRIEDAGFEIRDMIAWVYGSGFPKSLDVSKAIDKVNGEAGRLHKFTAWMRTTGLTGKQINDATGTFMGSHYLTDKSQPAIPTPELWARLRPLCGDVPVWVDELVERIAAEREVVGRSENGIAGGTGKHAGQDAAYGFAGAYDITAPATEAARQWSGWGTALKPALEPVTVARKPLIGTVAANVLAHGTGALNIDGCRVGFESEDDKAAAKPCGKTTAKSGNLAGKSQDGFVVAGPVVDGERLYWSNETGWGSRDGATVFNDFDVSDPLEATGRETATQRAEFVSVQGTGRWPANLIHDGSDEVVAGFPQSSAKNGVTQGEGKGGIWSESTGKRAGPTHGDAGSAARFFYCAKASRKDRGEGNAHPTVKPTELMRYLCRLVTPPGGTVLDPFMGSGSTGKAALLEGFAFVGIEREQESFDTAVARIGCAGSDRAAAEVEVAQMELL